MQSKISKAIGMKHYPVALIRSDEKPENAIEFKEGKWGCQMWLIAHAAKGRTSVCSRETFGCFGGGVGMGFGNQYKNFPGGEECFCYFLSTGNEQWEKGRQAAEALKLDMLKEAHDHFVHGERYMKSPEHVKNFINCLPIVDIPEKYVIFKPLQDVNEAEKPQSVIFFADPDQFSALVILANYGRDNNENVIIPYAAGCQTMGIYPYKEAESEKPRAVAGLTDISARLYIRNQLGGDFMSFTVPFKMFREMEENVEGSFLEGSVWKKLRAGEKTE